MLLAEQPMHGYQLMQAISDRTNGAWRPSPGAVYPTLDQLEDEGLATIQQEGGRRLVTLTPEGQTYVTEHAAERSDPFGSLTDDPRRPGLRAPLDELRVAARQVAVSGSPAQVEAASQVLAQAKRSLYLILAGEPPMPTPDGLTATAIVSTPVPARYLKQLLSHLGHKAEIRSESEGERVVFGAGSCLLVEGSGVLELRASGETREGLEHIQEIVGGHLERFGERDGLVVSWQPA